MAFSIFLQRYFPIVTSSVAGFLTAGLADLLLILHQGGIAALPSAASSCVGLYGILGILIGTLAALATVIIDRAIPGGLAAISKNEPLDQTLAGMLLAFAGSALVLGLGAGYIQGHFIRPMASEKLASLATLGITASLLFPTGLFFLAIRPACTRFAVRALPHPKSLGRSGFLFLAMTILAILIFLGALSRADWRVLDLGPLASLGLAIAFASGHGYLWFVSNPGKKLLARIPFRLIRVGTTVLVIACLLASSRLSDTSPLFAALPESGLGLRFGIKVARALTDGDGDGFSARFGGVDCNDSGADIFPGADDLPGDGVDQNCEGGDAPPMLASAPKAADTAFAKTPRNDGFAGNLLLIAIDATRADRLGVAGYTRRGGKSLTPHLDALAKKGAYFRRVWAQAPNTPRSFPSFLTSRHPSEIDWKKRSLNYSPLEATNTTFFEPLVAGGFRALGFFSHFYFTADRGLSKGFAEWNNDGAKSIADSNKDIAAPRIVPKVIERLRSLANQKARFVLWTHLFEPHSSYMPHAEFPTSLRGVEGLEEKYDYEIAFADRWVGKILATLEETGLSQNTAVVVFGDHGEAWGEHQRTYFHGQNLTEEQLRVPLIITVPGKKPTQSDTEVALVDLGPTLLDLVGLPIPAKMRGRSLVPELDGETLPSRPVFAELLPSTATPDHQVMMIEQGKKLVHKMTARRFELYDLTRDPGETKNLADDPAQKETLRVLKEKLLAFEEHRLK